MVKCPVSVVSLLVYGNNFKNYQLPHVFCLGKKKIEKRLKKETGEVRITCSQRDNWAQLTKVRQIHLQFTDMEKVLDRV